MKTTNKQWLAMTPKEKELQIVQAAALSLNRWI